MSLQTVSHRHVNMLLWLLYPLAGLAGTSEADARLPSSDDKPKVAIIQYESGRVLVVREINGELLAVEPDESGAALLSRYLQSTQPTRENQPAEPAERTPPGQTATDAEPVFFSPAWYPEPIVINTNPPSDASPEGRAVERSKQNAAESRQQVKARRREQATIEPTNRAGQVYPSSAADQEQVDRLTTARQQAGGSAYVTFYSLGDGLEYYRQQELAARKELTLLTYDVLLEEGLRLLEQRKYAQAARSLVAAAQKDQGDSGARLHAAQCLMASGLYHQALDHVRRAFELAPQLIYRPLNHRRNYPHPEDFDQHLEMLKQYVASNADDDRAVVLLAYELFFSDRPTDAALALKRVRDLSKSDAFAKKLWEAAQPMLGDQRSASGG